MVKVVSRSDGDRWSLVRRTGSGADVLAHSAGGAHDRRPGGWPQDLARLCDGAGTMSVQATADGHYRWLLSDTDGRIIAESPAIFRSPDRCRDAFDPARRAAAAALGRRGEH